MKLYCDLKNAIIPHLVCIYNCPESVKVKCGIYSKNYEDLQIEFIDEFYISKYGEPKFPLPESILRKQKLLTKKEKAEDRKAKELEKENKRKIKEKKKKEKELIKNEKKKLREEKKLARMIKKEVSSRGRKAKLPEENKPAVKVISMEPVEKRKRGRPRKIVQEINTNFFE
jgi:hypothetical protein